MAKLRIRRITFAPSTTRLRVRRITFGGAAISQARLRIRRIRFAGEAISQARLRVLGVRFSGPSLAPNAARLRIRDVTFSGSKLGILSAASTKPASGAVVALIFAGEQDVPVVWRTVSTTNGAPAPMIVVQGLSAAAVMPAVSQQSVVVLGARQGSGAEQTIALTVEPTALYRRRGGVVLPVVQMTQRTSPFVP